MSVVDWALRAACRGVDDPEIFTVAAKDDALGQYANLRAKKLCSGCTVRVECAGFAVDTQAAGVIFGGNDTHTKPRAVRAPSSYDLRDCQECGERFEPLTSPQKFCRPECTLRADRKKKAARRRALGREPRTYVDRQREAVAALAGVGKTDVAIALKLGCSPKSVERVRSKHGIAAGSTLREAEETAA